LAGSSLYLWSFAAHFINTKKDAATRREKEQKTGNNEHRDQRGNLPVPPEQLEAII
jgi:hypothetical protein